MGSLMGMSGMTESSFTRIMTTPQCREGVEWARTRINSFSAAGQKEGKGGLEKTPTQICPHNKTSYKAASEERQNTSNPHNGVEVGRGPPSPAV